MDEMIRRLLALMTLTLTVVLLASAHTSAQSVPMTNEHIQRIKDNCQAADRTLTQLHVSDALLRVNRGQLYDLISTKLMARLNGRIALNKLDGARLVSATASFDRTLGNFRTRYQAYEQQLSTTLRIDCRQKPVEFYEAVQRTRELRDAVHEAVRNLGRYIDEYSQEFEAFRANLKQAKNGDNT